MTATNKPVLVKRCNYCPFAYRGIEPRADFCMYYDYADYDLSDITNEDVSINRDLPAPDWCPLRKSNIYVRIIPDVDNEG